MYNGQLVKINQTVYDRLTLPALSTVKVLEKSKKKRATSPCGSPSLKVEWNRKKPYLELGLKKVLNASEDPERSNPRK